jgi:hypothetical protein
MHTPTLSMLVMASFTACVVLGCAAQSDGSSDGSDQTDGADQGDDAVAATEDALAGGSHTGDIFFGSGCGTRATYEWDTTSNYFRSEFTMWCDPDATAQFTVCIDRYTSSGWSSISCNGWHTWIIGDGWVPMTNTEKSSSRSVSGVSNGLYRGRLAFWTRSTGWRRATTPAYQL